MSIQAPKASEGSVPDEQSKDNSPPGSWQSVIDCLDKFLNMVKENNVCESLAVALGALFPLPCQSFSLL